MITMVLLINSVFVITIELTSCSFSTHMLSSKHNPVGLTLVKYSHETGEKHDIEAAHTCVSNIQLHAKGLKRTRGLGHSIGINSRVTQQCNVVFYVYTDLCSLLAANSQFSILFGQKMQLTGCHDGNDMRNATCVDTKISIEWPYCSFLYCGLGACIYRV